MKTQTTNRYRLYIIILPFIFTVVQVNSPHAKGLAKLSEFIGRQDAVLVSDPKGGILFSKNAGLARIPASTLKIFTSLVALHYLGPEYRFATEFYLDHESNLIMKGYGDPLLISEVLREIVNALSALSPLKNKYINDLVLDDTYFKSPAVIPGITSSYNPYDAPNGALCVNFNSVAFKTDKNGTVVSAEPQTPLLPFVLPRIIASNTNEGRINLSSNNSEITIYAGHLFSYFLQEKGIDTNGIIRTGIAQKNEDKLIFSYNSRFTLEQVVAKLLEFSNNFIANQLLLASGVCMFGPPGTLEKGVRAATIYAHNILKINHMQIIEGSGISKKNRISSLNFYKILKAFQPFHSLMPRTGRQFYKTGTLYGVHTRVGYIENKNGELYSFIVLINTPGKSPDRIMDIILKAIE